MHVDVTVAVFCCYSSIALSTQHFTSTTVVITSTVSLLDSNNSTLLINKQMCILFAEQG